MNVAEAVVEGFVREGVRIGAGVGGESIRLIANAVYSNPGIRMIYARHERGATDIADGYARISGVPGLVFTDAGPAVAHTLAGIVQAYGDSTPLVFIASERPRVLLGRRAYKEINVHDVFSSVTKWTTAITDPSQVSEMVRRAAVAVKSGRPGPVVIALPSDVAAMPAEGFDYEPVLGPIRYAGDPTEIERAVQALATAEHPYVYVGAGVLFARATDELIELAELLSLPVATTLNGKSAFPESHPLSLGIGGFPRALYGAQHATEFAKRADLVLTIGAGFKEHAAKGEFPGAFTHIQVDVDPYESHKMRRADSAIVGDAKLVLRQMIDAARAMLPASRLEPRAGVREEIARGRAAWEELCRPLVTSNERPINPFRVTAEINQLTDSRDTIVLHDAGSTRGSTCQHIVSETPRSFVGQGTQSSMGWSLGAAIGAKLAAPEKLVITFTGDEAFGETAMELETAARNNIPILVLLNNNSGVPGDGSSLRHISMREEYAVGGDYTGLARALGTEAMRIEDPNELRNGLERAIETVRGGRPMVVELVTKRVPTTLYPLEVAVDV